MCNILSVSEVTVFFRKINEAYLSVVRRLADVIADGKLEGLVLVLLSGGDDARRVQEFQFLLRLWAKNTWR